MAIAVTGQKLLKTKSEERDVKIRALDEVDFSDLEKLREMAQDLIII